MPRHLLEHDRRLHVPETEPAPLLTDRHAEQIGGGQGLDPVLGEVTGLVSGTRPRPHLTRRHVTRQLAKRGLVFILGHRVDTLGSGHGHHFRQGPLQAMGLGSQ